MIQHKRFSQPGAAEVCNKKRELSGVGLGVLLYFLFTSMLFQFDKAIRLNRWLARYPSEDNYQVCFCQWENRVLFCI